MIFSLSSTLRGGGNLGKNFRKGGGERSPILQGRHASGFSSFGLFFIVREYRPKIRVVTQVEERRVEKFECELHENKLARVLGLQAISIVSDCVVCSLEHAFRGCRCRRNAEKVSNEVIP